MKIFRKCFWCDSPVLEPDLMDYVFGSDFGTKKLSENKKSNAVKDYHSDKFNQCCTVCGNTIFPIYMNSIDKIIKYCHDLYEEYKKFINNAPLPDKIDIRCKENMGYKAICDYDPKLKIWYVEFGLEYIVAFPFLKCLMAHEYTHILQGYNPATGGKKQTDRFEKWFCEYQAMEYQLKSALHFENINDNKKIRLGQKIITEDNKAITLRKYLNNMLNDWSNAFIMICEKEIKTFDDMALLTKNIMYFRGTINFCKRYLHNDLSELEVNGNELEILIIEKLSNNNSILSKLLADLDTHLSDSIDNVNGEIVDNIMGQIIRILVAYNVKDYEQLKLMYKSREEVAQIKNNNTQEYKEYISLLIRTQGLENAIKIILEDNI